MEYQFVKERIFWKWNTIGGCNLGTIVSAHALVALAWCLEMVSRKFATPSNSVFRDVSGHSGVPGCSGVPWCSGVPTFSTCLFFPFLAHLHLFTICTERDLGIAMSSFRHKPNVETMWRKSSWTSVNSRQCAEKFPLVTSSYTSFRLFLRDFPTKTEWKSNRDVILRIINHYSSGVRFRLVTSTPAYFCWACQFFRLIIS